MARKFYSAYVEHHMRYYARYEKPNFFRCHADERSWYACKYVLDELSEKDRERILEIYRLGDTIPDNIYQLAKSENLNQDWLWKLLADFERNVALKRGLI